MTAELWLVLGISGIAVFMDFLMERVVNSFICMGLVLGLYYQISTGSVKGMIVYVLGILVPFFLLLPLFYFRMLGAGDIKLFCVLGSVLGYETIVKIMVCSFFLGSVIIFSISNFLWKSERKMSLFFSLFVSVWENKEPYFPYIKKGRKAENFHFTVPILLGVMLYAGGFY